MGITVGVIGCGSISRFHFPGLAKAGARVKWICDINQAAAQPRLEETGGQYTDDYAAIMRDPEVDAVFVLTTSPSHKQLCLAAIEAGKAVVCEKTLATNADDALEITRAAKDKGTLFYTCYMKRYFRAMQKAKELLPELGRIVSSYFRAHQPWGDVWKPGAFPRGADGRSAPVRAYGGGVLVCGGSHTYDLVGFLVGRPKRMWAQMTQFPDSDVDLQASVLLETDNGPAHYEALGHPLRCIGFLREGWDETVEITGTRGRLNVYVSKWDQPDLKTALLVHHDNETCRSTEYRYPVESPFAIAVAHFCSQIEKGEQGPQPITTGYDVDELIAHTMRSAQSGEAVDIDWRI